MNPRGEFVVCSLREGGLCACMSVGPSMRLALLFSVCDLVGTLAFQISYQAAAEYRIPEPLAPLQGLRWEEGGKKEI